MGLYVSRSNKCSSSILSLADVFYMHTLGAADVLNVAHGVGIVEVNKFADLILTNPPSDLQLEDLVSAVVFHVVLKI